MKRRDFAGGVLGLALAAAVLSAQTAPAPAQTPVPKPFPNSGQPPAARPATPQTAPPGALDVGTVDPLLAGYVVPTGTEFLESFDLGRNQRLFTFGTNDAYDGIVAFYKAYLRKSGDEVSRQPAIQQFDIGSFNSSTMSQRPSVIVKDYTWPESTGYVHVEGTTEKRFRTLIQIIPAARQP
jgi:hypothetical protein